MSRSAVRCVVAIRRVERGGVSATYICVAQNICGTIDLRSEVEVFRAFLFCLLSQIGSAFLIINKIREGIEPPINILFNKISNRVKIIGPPKTKSYYMRTEMQPHKHTHVFLITYCQNTVIF